jgi:hypothetical protein
VERCTCVHYIPTPWIQEYGANVYSYTRGVCNVHACVYRKLDITSTADAAVDISSIFLDTGCEPHNQKATTSPRGLSQLPSVTGTPKTMSTRVVIRYMSGALHVRPLQELDARRTHICACVNLTAATPRVTMRAALLKPVIFQARRTHAYLKADTPRAITRVAMLKHQRNKLGTHASAHARTSKQSRHTTRNHARSNAQA